MKEQILAVQRMQDYIEAHLDEKIGLSELSSVSLFSPWYSYRLFQEYTGLTPSGYIRRLRLARAALPVPLPGSLECVPVPMLPNLFPSRCSFLSVQNSEHSERM